jgi:hypothetical protein
MTDPYAVRPGPMPFRILLDEAMRMTRQHFRTIYPSVAIPVALLTTATYVVQAQFYSELTGGFDPVGMLRMYPLLLLLSFLVIAVLVIGYNAMQVAALDATAGRPVSMGLAWRFTFQGRVLGTLFLWGAATVLSLMCCLVPALYVVPLLSFVPPAMVEEGRFGFAAFSRSAELAQYNPSRQFANHPMVKIFTLLFVSVILSYAVQLLVTVPFQIPMYVDMFRGTATGEEMLQEMPRWMWLQVPAQFLSSLVSVAVYLYTCFGTALLFNDTRGRKEGTDLRSEIDAMFPGPVPPPVPPAGEPWP